MDGGQARIEKRMMVKEGERIYKEVDGGNDGEGRGEDIQGGWMGAMMVKGRGGVRRYKEGGKGKQRNVDEEVEKQQKDAKRDAKPKYKKCKQLHL
jgi:hypothetical protein